ncbi:MAG: hypothetical protein KGJ37_03350, partial [Verrucomicrobiota bacterium]|nr:hypothetical protein [Verrucomicrobiota bacterium]
MKNATRPEGGGCRLRLGTPYHGRQFFNFIFLLAWLVGSIAQAAPEPPAEWIDSTTGHRVIRLSREPGSTSLYFHQNAYSADGQKLVIVAPSGLSTVNLKTRAVEQIVSGKVHALMTGRKTGQIYYLRDGTVYATDLDTRATREIAKFPSELEMSTNLAIN